MLRVSSVIVLVCALLAGLSLGEVGPAAFEKARATQAA
jgi:hypothetical protein